MNIFFVDLDKKRRKEFQTYFERAGFKVNFFEFEEFESIDSNKFSKNTVVVICSENIEKAIAIFDISLSFAKNVILLKDGYSHGWYRVFHKKGVFDFLKFMDGMDEISDTVYLAFKEMNPLYKNKLLEREKSLLKVVKEVCLTLEFSQLLNLIVDTLLDLSKSENAMLLLDEIEFGISEIKRGEFCNQEFVYSLLQDGVNMIEKGKRVENEGCVYLIFPLWLERQTKGLIVIEVNKNNFKNDFLFTGENFLKEIEPALTNSLHVEKTKQLTTLDDLTSCYNRRFFDEYIEIVFQKAREKNKKFSIIFMDLDNLKEVNTKYGHLVGSQILKVIAEKTIEAVRGIDKVCRFGGDEFCIILPDTDSKGAKRVAERIRENITKNEYFLKDYPDVKVTASFGIATYPDHGDSPEALIKVADNAMYMVKMQGKNGIFLPESIENE